MADNAWTRFWSELWRRLTSYYEQSQVGNQATAETAMEFAESVHNGATSPAAVDRVGTESGVVQQDNASAQDVGLDYVYDGGHLANNVTGQTEDLRAQSQENYAAYLRSKDLLTQQQDFSERMSNTAIQRQMADAKAAGVNPYYLFSGGANSGAGVANPSGASSVGAPMTGGNSGASVAATIGALGSVITSVIKLLA